MDSLGAGGQGEVFIALDTSRVNLETSANIAARAIASLHGVTLAGQRPIFLKELASALRAVEAEKDSAYLGALKLLHKPKDQAGYEKAKERMMKEVTVYESVSHPNLLRILDKNLEQDWFVTEYQPLGTLATHLDRYKGDLLAVLRAIRPIVDAVAELHRRGFVHRDIKPANIFLGLRGELILGDAGLVFFTDEKYTRVSDTFENVGSRDWMPGWAMGMRIEDIRPSFDIFSVGKLLWSMVAGQPVLQLWYLHKAQFELEQMFPADVDMKWARFVLDRCVVEEETQCLRDAMELLRYIDRAILALRRGAQVIGEGVQRLCSVCALGVYRYVANENHIDGGNFGLRGAGLPPKIFACDHCGHVQIFHMGPTRPPAWPPKTRDA